ncbi:MAG TPA: glycosyltransferase [Paraburkholderia sp.]|jgi:UDP-N-acetylmuramyl pentapeptide phosphotransferase/UDP-N-acetylglucosamine-1-phosphate transferase|nr:glycosyltransferase [Paraburkholderia sp.]
MIGISLGLLVSFFVTLAVVRVSPRLGHVLLDHELKGVQKFHATPVPRIGGLGVFLSFCACVAAAGIFDTGLMGQMLVLLACSLPAFGSGLVEDVTKRVSPRARLLCTMAATLAACFALDATVNRLDLPMIDPALHFAPVAIVLTVIAVAGMANSVNLIDGLNGLASVTAVTIFGSIALVAHQVGDPFVQTVALTMIGATLGFIILNFPSGAIFLGDGGAYFIGFMLGETLVLLITRHPEVSPSYVMVALYPLFETVFSIYRRVIVRGHSAGAPDAVHLHTLLYRRIMRTGLQSGCGNNKVRRNSMTSPYLWTLNLLAVVPATLFWDNSAVLLVCTLLFAVVYVALYRSVVKFRTPALLLAPRRRLLTIGARPAVFQCGQVSDSSGPVNE